MTPKDFSIRIGDVTLNTNNIPNEGLDYSKLDQNTKNMLSVFDTDNQKGHLSSKELKNLFNFLENHDVTYTENFKRENGDIVETGLRVHKKNDELDKTEQDAANKDLKNKLSSKIKDNTNVNVKDLAVTIASQFKKQQRMHEMGLLDTYNSDFCKDKNGKHYKWNGTNFEEQKDVFYVSKKNNDGSYYTKTKVDKEGRFSQKTYDKEGMLTSIQLKNTQKENGKNKTFTYSNPDFVAKKLGLICPRKIAIEKAEAEAPVDLLDNKIIQYNIITEAVIHKGQYIADAVIYEDSDKDKYIFLNNKFERVYN